MSDTDEEIFEESMSSTDSVRVPKDSPVLTVGLKQPSEKIISRMFWILIAYTVLRNLLTALAKPLWFDELLTSSISSRPSLHAVWHATSASKDANPPLFYIVEHWFGALPVNEHIAYRLASILGFACMLACIFYFLRRRVGGKIAFVCTSVLLLTPFLRPYAVEARPYSMVAACLALALICYTHAPDGRWMILMALALAAAQSFHYYAMFAFFPFGVGEFVVVMLSRRIRWTVWLAIAAGFIPLIAFWPLLNGIKVFYGSHVWDKPSLFAVANVYSLLFKSNPPIVLGLVIALALIALTSAEWARVPMSLDQRVADSGERFLTVAFFFLPLLVFVAAKITHGAYLERYVLPTLFALPLSLSYLLMRLPRRLIALAAVFVFAAVFLQEAFFWQSAVHDARHFVSPAQPIDEIVLRSGHADLPVVVSDGHDYFQVAHYSPNASRYSYLVDPPQAIRYVGSDTIDLQLPVMSCCVALQVHPYANFTAQHRAFLLYAGGGQWDWWPERLADDGDSLQLLADDHGRRVYLVQLNRQ